MLPVSTLGDGEFDIKLLISRIFNLLVSQLNSIKQLAPAIYSLAIYGVKAAANLSLFCGLEVAVASDLESYDFSTLIPLSMPAFPQS